MWAASAGPMPFVILASGAGTNARALLERAREKADSIEVKALVSDREGAGALKMAEEFGVRTAVIPVKEEARLLDFLAETGSHWACLAGYRRLVSQAFLDFFFCGRKQVRSGSQRASFTPSCLSRPRRL